MLIGWTWVFFIEKIFPGAFFLSKNLIRILDDLIHVLLFGSTYICFFFILFTTCFNWSVTNSFEQYGVLFFFRFCWFLKISIYQCTFVPLSSLLVIHITIYYSFNLLWQWRAIFVAMVATIKSSSNRESCFTQFSFCTYFSLRQKLTVSFAIFWDIRSIGMALPSASDNQNLAEYVVRFVCLCPCGGQWIVTCQRFWRSQLPQTRVCSDTSVLILPDVSLFSRYYS